MGSWITRFNLASNDWSIIQESARRNAHRDLDMYESKGVVGYDRFQRNTQGCTCLRFGRSTARDIPLMHQSPDCLLPLRMLCQASNREEPFV